MNAAMRRCFRTRAAGLVDVLAIMCLLLVMAAVLFPMLAVHEAPQRSVCLSNVKQLDLTFFMYASDYDNRLPAGDRWMDNLGPYTKDPAIFHCVVGQELDPNKYGYAMRARLASLDIEKIQNPDKEVLVFDSNLTGRNAYTNVVIDPDFTRHPAQNLGYADGHAKPWQPNPRVPTRP